MSLSHAPGTQKYVATGLTAVGALLSGYVAKTFLDRADAANQQQSLYYQEPHMTGRLIRGEQIADAMCPGKRSEEGVALIKQLLDWPLPEIDGAEKSDGASKPDKKPAPASPT